jgi:hypothetical protein
VTQVRSNGGVEMRVGERRRPSWLANGLLVLGAWLVLSPMLLGTAQVTAGATSAVTSGLALMVLSGWTRVAHNRVPPMLIALAFGVWLLLAPSIWEFADGVDGYPLTPISPSEVTEPTRAMVARAEWNSILAGLLILVLAGSVLAAAARRRSRRRPSAGRERWRQVEAPDRRG